jgi:uncharacterized membrane protein
LSIFVVYLIVFLLAAVPFFELVVVIPIGIAGGLNSFLVSVLAFLGNIATILLIILLMDHIKSWLQKRRERKGEGSFSKRYSRAERVWKKYGLPGLALISPFLIGSHLGAVLAMGFGGTRKQITFWMTTSLVLWTVIMGVASHYGIDFLFQQTGREGFLTDILNLER